MAHGNPLPFATAASRSVLGARILRGGGAPGQAASDRGTLRSWNDRAIEPRAAPARRARARARAVPARDLLPQHRGPGPRARARARARAVRRQSRQRAGRPDRARGAVAARAALPRQTHALEQPGGLAAAPARGRGAGVPRAGGRHRAQPGDVRALLRGARARRRGGAVSRGHQPRPPRAPAAAHRRGADRARRARRRAPSRSRSCRSASPSRTSAGSARGCCSAWASRSPWRPPPPTTPSPCARSPKRSMRGCAR